MDSGLHSGFRGKPLTAQALMLPLRCVLGVRTSSTSAVLKAELT